MILTAHHLEKRFQQGDTPIDVLRDVSLEVKEGETVAVLGQSGSGKSTLLSLLAGLDHPTSGEVRIRDTSISGMDETALARFRAANLGIVFQQFHLMPSLTALENVRLPLDIARDKTGTERAQRCLELVGLAHRGEHYPAQMSGGECQRVAIARAMVVEPAILLADEPSGNLDAETGDRVLSLLFDLVRTQRMTLLLVTHNDELARRCQRRVRLKEGRLVEVS